MNYFTVVKLKPAHVLEAAASAVKAGHKALSRRKRKADKPALRKRLGILKDAQASIDARQWADKQAGKGYSTHNALAGAIKAPLPPNTFIVAYVPYSAFKAPIVRGAPPSIGKRFDPIKAHFDAMPVNKPKKRMAPAIDPVSPVSAVSKITDSPTDKRCLQSRQQVTTCQCGKPITNGVRCPACREAQFQALMRDMS